ncbi:MAG: host attachment family protein [Bauldia sp.]|mgnify:CR=1 FL=1
MSAVKIPHDAWVLVADGEKAMVFRNEGDERFPNLKVEQRFEQALPSTRAQGADRPGRVHESVGERRSSVEATDWHRLEKVSFAKTIAEALYRSAHAKAFSALVVVAPPLTLHSLREALHAEVKKLVVAEINKTLTQHPVYEIESILTGQRV